MLAAVALLAVALAGVCAWAEGLRREAAEARQEADAARAWAECVEEEAKWWVEKATEGRGSDFGQRWPGDR
jgi:hypothetical protein